VTHNIGTLLQPVVRALIEEQPFDWVWPPGGPWREARLLPKDLFKNNSAHLQLNHRDARRGLMT
jgi:hypothetical protein